MWACSRGHHQIAEALMEAGASPDTPNNEGYTALIEACIRNHIDVVRVLLDAGADTDAENKNGNTALSLAISHGRAEVEQALLEAGASRGAVPVAEAVADTAAAMPTVAAGCSEYDSSSEDVDST
jgi:ankyrin repeat protein